MKKSFLVAGSIFAGLGVALGAFGAHGLQKMTDDPRILHGFETATEYQVYHAFALLITGILYEKFQAKAIRWAGYLFITGIILFSGSLYLLTFLKIQQNDAVKILGPVTPIGGICFIAGWLALLVAVTRKN